MRKSETPPDRPIKIVLFNVTHRLGSWQVQRNGRLVTFFPERHDAVKAAHQYADAVIAAGGEAHVQVSH